MRYKWRFEF